MILVVVGTAMMWVGWLGFNACAAKTVSRQAAMAVVNTQISAAFGGISWVLMDYHLDSEWSIVGLCSGVVAGLVTVTPGAGYVHPWAASLFGIFGGICCNFGTQLKFYLATDDALDVLAIHGVGGFVGTLLTGIFASRGLEPNARGGFVDGNYMQLIDQLIAVAAGAIYSFVVSYLILILLNRTKGLQLRVPPEHELVGLDIVEHDEFAYDVSDFFATEGPEVPPEVQSYSDDPDRGDSDRGGPFLNSSMFPGRL
jgi:Amt family ammonium transporter